MVVTLTNGVFRDIDIVYSGVRDSGLFSFTGASNNGANSGLFEGARIQKITDDKLLITLSGTNVFVSKSEDRVKIEPTAFYATGASESAVAQSYLPTNTAAATFTTSGLDNRVYIKLSNSGVFAPELTSGHFTFGASAGTNSGFLSLGTIVRVSDTEAYIIPSSGLVNDNDATANTITLLSSGFTQVLSGLATITVNSSFVNPVGVSVTTINLDGTGYNGLKGIRVNLSSGQIVAQTLSQSDITFSGLNKSLFEAANIIVAANGESFDIQGFTNVIAAPASFEIILKPSAFVRGNTDGSRSGAGEITMAKAS
jgi:hypothetical protein